MTDHEHAKVCAEYREDGECSCPTDQNQADAQRAREDRYAQAAWAEGRTCDRNTLRAYLKVVDKELDSVHQALAEERDVAVRKEAENVRLRAELGSAHEAVVNLTTGHNRIINENKKLRTENDRLLGKNTLLFAAIERVQTVLDNPYHLDADAVAEVRAALEGDSK